MLSPFSSVQLFVTLWTPARQAPLSMELSRQEYWSRVSCLLPVDLFDPGTEPGSPELAGWFFTTSTNRMPYYWFFNLSLLTPPSFSAKLLPILPVLVSFFHDYYTHTPNKFYPVNFCFVSCSCQVVRTMRHLGRTPTDLGFPSFLQLQCFLPRWCDNFSHTFAGWLMKVFWSNDSIIEITQLVAWSLFSSRL